MASQKKKNKLKNSHCVKGELKNKDWKCKRIEALEKENAELKIRLTNANLKRLEMQVAKDSHRDRARKAHEQLAKANELILKLSTCLEGHSNNNFEYELLKEAFGFLEDNF